MKKLDPHDLRLGSGATLCKFSYMDPAEAVDAATAIGLDNAAFLDEGPDARVLAGRLGGLEVLVFQGTKNPRGWWRNFDARRVEVSAAVLNSGNLGARGEALGKAHRGIAGSWSKVAEFCADRAEGAESVALLGHSAGGMIGSMAALGLAVQGHEVSHVVTYGKARWCNRNLGKALRRHGRVGDLWRVVLHRDGVCLLPLVGSWAGRYQHETGRDGVEDGAKVLFIDERNRATVDPGRWARAKARFRAGGTEPTVEDIGGVTGEVVGRLADTFGERLDGLIGKTAGAIATAAGLPLPVAGVVARQVRELAVGAWLVGLFGEAVYDHKVSGYEHALHVAGV